MRKGRVGLVSGNSDFLGLARERFREAGYHAVTCPGDYDDCLVMLQIERPHVWILEAAARDRADVARAEAAGFRPGVILGGVDGYVASGGQGLRGLIASVRGTMRHRRARLIARQQAEGTPD